MKEEIEEIPFGITEEDINNFTERSERERELIARVEGKSNTQERTSFFNPMIFEDDSFKYLDDILKNILEEHI